MSHIARDNKEWMISAMRAAESKMPDSHAIMLFSYPIGHPGELRYSSTMAREDAIILMKQWLFVLGEKEAWMNHIK